MWLVGSSSIKQDLNRTVVYVGSFLWHFETEKCL